MHLIGAIKCTSTRTTDRSAYSVYSVQKLCEELESPRETNAQDIFVDDFYWTTLGHDVYPPGLICAQSSGEVDRILSIYSVPTVLPCPAFSYPRRNMSWSRFHLVYLIFHPPSTLLPFCPSILLSFYPSILRPFYPFLFSPFSFHLMRR